MVKPVEKVGKWVLRFFFPTYQEAFAFQEARFVSGLGSLLDSYDVLGQWKSLDLLFLSFYWIDLFIEDHFS